MTAQPEPKESSEPNNPKLSGYIDKGYFEVGDGTYNMKYQDGTLWSASDNAPKYTVIESSQDREPTCRIWYEGNKLVIAGSFKGTEAVVRNGITTITVDLDQDQPYLQNHVEE